MQTRENRILNIEPILREKISKMLNCRPDWATYESIEKTRVIKKVLRHQHELQSTPKHGQQSIPKHGQQTMPPHGKGYTQYNVVERVEEKEEIITKKTADFIEINLFNFILLCGIYFEQLNLSDCESIGTQFPTPNVKKLYQLLDYLIQNGFPGPREIKKPINFWSGDIAVKKAAENQNEISAIEIPAISVLFDVCQAIKEIHVYDSTHIHLIESCIMRLFASYATEVASIYISSDKASESAGFTTGNVLWTDELVVLRELKKRGIVKDIQIHLYDNEKKQWKAPVSFLSAESYNIPIRARCTHSLDSPDIADRFKKPDMTKSEKIAWRGSLPRPEISFGKMREIARNWCQKAEYKQTSEKFLSELKEKCEELIKIYKEDIAREWQNFNTAYYINIGVNAAYFQQYKKLKTETAIQEFKKNKYYAQSKAKLDALELIKKTDSIHDAKIIFEKNKEIFAVERDKYKTRILRGISLILSFGLSYGLSHAKNLNQYFKHTRSSMELENILEPATASLNRICIR